MFRSIRWRLILSYVLLALLTVSLVGVLGLSLLQQYISQQEREHLTANAETVARQAAPLMWPVLRQRELQDLAQTSSFLGNARVRILAMDQRVLADYSPSTQGDDFVWILPPVAWRIEVASEPSLPFIVALPSGRQFIAPVRNDGQVLMLNEMPAGTSFVVVRRWEGTWGSRFTFGTSRDQGPITTPPNVQEQTPRSEHVISVAIGEAQNQLGFVEMSNGPDLGAQALATIRRAFLLAAAGATLLAAGVGLVVSRQLAAPLRNLAHVAGRMGSGDLSTRAPVQGKDEIGQLAGQFNQMAGRLESSFADLAAERDALRRFIADASHELRTPITALKSFNDLLQGAAADDPVARAEFLAESQVQIERLEWITRNLLDLSRLDAGLVALERTRHDVGALLEAATSTFKTLAQEKGIELSIRRPEPPVEIECDGARIELALSNLLDNALKFTPAGGWVRVGAEQKEGIVRLEVQDSGPGIDPADRPRLFERFYRSRRNHAEGSGLGLAIVQSIVRAHGGQVSVESEPGKGSLFTLELPQP
jgi:signal transduction histidine kinase